MTVTITLNGTTTLDEDALLQNSTATPSVPGDADDNDVTLARLQTFAGVAAFNSRLFGSIASGGLNLSTAFAGNGRISESTQILTISSTGTISNVAFTDSTGAALNGADSGLDALSDDANILLFTDPTNDNIVLGKASTDGRVVFAAYIEEVKVNGVLVGAKIWMVTFEPIEHDSILSADDAKAILADRLFVSASEELNFDLNTLASGQNAWNAFGDLNNQIIVISDEAGQTVNTSKGGGNTTIGNSNQLLDGVDPGKDTNGEAMVFTFVKDSPSLLTLDKGNADNITYSDLLNAKSAQWSISQTQGGSPFAVATITALSTAKETGAAFFPGLSNDGAPIAITSVTIKNGTTTLLAAVDDDLTPGNTEIDSVPRTVGKGGNAQTFPLSVTFNTDGTVTIRGLRAKDEISYTTISDHNRVKIANTGDDATSLDWDIGGFKLLEVASTSKDVGPSMFIEDSGPTTNNNLLGRVHEDALTTAGTPPADLSQGNGEVTVPAQTKTISGTLLLGVAPGTDAPAQFKLVSGTGPTLTSKGETVTYLVTQTAGVGTESTSDDVYTLTASAGGREVFTFTVANNGNFTFDLNDQIDHPDGSGDSAVRNINLTPFIEVTDKEGDPAPLAASFATVDIENDIPIQNANTSIGVVEEEQLAGGNEDTTSDVVPNLDTDPSPEVTAVATGSLATLITVGADEAATFKLSATGATLPVLNSGGAPVKYDVNADGTLLTGYLDNGDDVLGAGDTPVFTFALSGAAWTFTLLKTLDHPGVGEDVISIDLSSFVKASDFDKDTITLDNGSLVMKVIDDKPIVSTNATALLDDDALAGGNPGGTGDDANAANTSGTLLHSYGADGAGTTKLLGAGLPTSSPTEGAFIQTLNAAGTSLQIKQMQGGVAVTVLTVALTDDTSGAYTVTQNANILHAAGNNENNQAFTVGYRVTDKDGDFTDGTLGVNVDDDTPLVTVDDLAGSFTTAVQSSTWSDLPGADLFKSLNITLDSYQINANPVVSPGTSLGTVTAPDVNGNYVFTGSITDDFTDDGVVNNQTVNFTLTFNPGTDTYDFQTTTPPGSTTTISSANGQLDAGGPDPVRTLTIGTKDIVFSAVNATTDANLIKGFLDADEANIQANATYLSPAQMNVSTAGIGLGDNNFDGNANTGIDGVTTLGGKIDESFVIDPHFAVSGMKIFIDNSQPYDLVVKGNKVPDELYVRIYHTDGSVSPLSLPTAKVTSLTPEAGGQHSFFVGSTTGPNNIDAVQLFMGTGTVKIPVIEFSVTTENPAQPLAMNFTATLFDKDDDSATDTFSIDLDAVA